MNRDDLRLIAEKTLLKLSGLFGYQLKPKLSSVAKPIDILRLAIRDMMRRQENIFFVQIGAHDGKTDDPISSYIRALGWSGLLIEPQPSVFLKLKEHYAGNPNLIFENVAIGENDGTLKLHCFKHASPDDHASMLASTRKHYLQLNSDKARGELDEIEVPMRTLKNLLAQHGISEIDLLQIDTEGYDFQILRSIDFTSLRPKIIHFENNFLNSRQRNECAEILAAQGYALMDLGIDTLAYQQEKDAAFEKRMTLSRVGEV